MKLVFRNACENDLSDLIRMLSDDELGTEREAIGEPINQRYISAFRGIDKDPNNALIVMENDANVACCS